MEQDEFSPGQRNNFVPLSPVANANANDGAIPQDVAQLIDVIQNLTGPTDASLQECIKILENGLDLTDEQASFVNSTLTEISIPLELRLMDELNNSNIAGRSSGSPSHQYHQQLNSTPLNANLMNIPMMSPSPIRTRIQSEPEPQPEPGSPNSTWPSFAYDPRAMNTTTSPHFSPAPPRRPVLIRESPISSAIHQEQEQLRPQLSLETRALIQRLESTPMTEDEAIFRSRALVQEHGLNLYRLPHELAFDRTIDDVPARYYGVRVLTEQEREQILADQLNQDQEAARVVGFRAHAPVPASQPPPPPLPLSPQQPLAQNSNSSSFGLQLGRGGFNDTVSIQEQLNNVRVKLETRPIRDKKAMELNAALNMVGFRLSPRSSPGPSSGFVPVQADPEGWPLTFYDVVPLNPQQQEFVKNLKQEPPKFTPADLKNPQALNQNIDQLQKHLRANPLTDLAANRLREELQGVGRELIMEPHRYDKPKHNNIGLEQRYYHVKTLAEPEQGTQGQQIDPRVRDLRTSKKAEFLEMLERLNLKRTPATVKDLAEFNKIATAFGCLAIPSSFGQYREEEEQQAEVPLDQQLHQNMRVVRTELYDGQRELIADPRHYPPLPAWIYTSELIIPDHRIRELLSYMMDYPLTDEQVVQIGTRISGMRYAVVSQFGAQDGATRDFYIGGIRRAFYTIEPAAPTQPQPQPHDQSNSDDTCRLSQNRTRSRNRNLDEIDPRVQELRISKKQEFLQMIDSLNFRWEPKTLEELAYYTTIAALYGHVPTPMSPDNYHIENAQQQHLPENDRIFTGFRIIRLELYQGQLQAAYHQNQVPGIPDWVYTPNVPVTHAHILQLVDFLIDWPITLQQLIDIDRRIEPFGYIVADQQFNDYISSPESGNVPRGYFTITSTSPITTLPAPVIDGAGPQQQQQQRNSLPPVSFIKIVENLNFRDAPITQEQFKQFLIIAKQHGFWVIPRDKEGDDLRQRETPEAERLYYCDVIRMNEMDLQDLKLMQTLPNDPPSGMEVPLPSWIYNNDEIGLSQIMEMYEYLLQHTVTPQQASDIDSRLIPFDFYVTFINKYEQIPSPEEIQGVYRTGFTINRQSAEMSQLNEGLFDPVDMARLGIVPLGQSPGRLQNQGQNAGQNEIAKARAFLVKMIHDINFSGEPIVTHEMPLIDQAIASLGHKLVRLSNAMWELEEQDQANFPPEERYHSVRVVRMSAEERRLNGVENTLPSAPRDENGTAIPVQLPNWVYTDLTDLAAEPNDVMELIDFLLQYTITLEQAAHLDSIFSGTEYWYIHFIERPVQIPFSDRNWRTGFVFDAWREKGDPPVLFSSEERARLMNSSPEQVNPTANPGAQNPSPPPQTQKQQIYRTALNSSGEREQHWQNFLMIMSTANFGGQPMTASRRREFGPITRLFGHVIEPASRDILQIEEAQQAHLPPGQRAFTAYVRRMTPQERQAHHAQDTLPTSPFRQNGEITEFVEPPIWFVNDTRVDEDTFDELIAYVLLYTLTPQLAFNIQSYLNRHFPFFYVDFVDRPEPSESLPVDIDNVQRAAFTIKVLPKGQSTPTPHLFDAGELLRFGIDPTLGSSSARNRNSGQGQGSQGSQGSSSQLLPHWVYAQEAIGRPQIMELVQYLLKHTLTPQEAMDIETRIVPSGYYIDFIDDNVDIPNADFRAAFHIRRMDEGETIPPLFSREDIERLGIVIRSQGQIPGQCQRPGQSPGQGQCAQPSPASSGQSDVLLLLKMIEKLNLNNVAINASLLADLKPIAEINGHMIIPNTSEGDPNDLEVERFTSPEDHNYRVVRMTREERQKFNRESTYPVPPIDQQGASIPLPNWVYTPQCFDHSHVMELLQFLLQYTLTPQQASDIQTRLFYSDYYIDFDEPPRPPPGAIPSPGIGPEWRTAFTIRRRTGLVPSLFTETEMNRLRIVPFSFGQDRNQGQCQRSSSRQVGSFSIQNPPPLPDFIYSFGSITTEDMDILRSYLRTYPLSQAHAQDVESQLRIRGFGLFRNENMPPVISSLETGSVARHWYRIDRRNSNLNTDNPAPFNASAAPMHWTRVQPPILEESGGHEDLGQSSTRHSSGLGQSQLHNLILEQSPILAQNSQRLSQSPGQGVSGGQANESSLAQSPRQNQNNTTIRENLNAEDLRIIQTIIDHVNTKNPIPDQKAMEYCSILHNIQLTLSPLRRTAAEHAENQRMFPNRLPFRYHVVRMRLAELEPPPAPRQQQVQISPVKQQQPLQQTPPRDTQLAPISPQSIRGQQPIQMLAGKPDSTPGYLSPVSNYPLRTADNDEQIVPGRINRGRPVQANFNVAPVPFAGFDDGPEGLPVTSQQPQRACSSSSPPPKEGAFLSPHKSPGTEGRNSNDTTASTPGNFEPSYLVPSIENKQANVTDNKSPPQPTLGQPMSQSASKSSSRKNSNCFGSGPLDTRESHVDQMSFSTSQAQQSAASASASASPPTKSGKGIRITVVNPPQSQSENPEDMGSSGSVNLRTSGRTQQLAGMVSKRCAYQTSRPGCGLIKGNVNSGKVMLSSSCGGWAGKFGGELTELGEAEDELSATSSSNSSADSAEELQGSILLPENYPELAATGSGSGKSSPLATGGKSSPPATGGKSSPPATGGKSSPPATVLETEMESSVPGFGSPLLNSFNRKTLPQNGQQHQSPPESSSTAPSNDIPSVSNKTTRSPQPLDTPMFSHDNAITNPFLQPTGTGPRSRSSPLPGVVAAGLQPSPPKAQAQLPPHDSTELDNVFGFGTGTGTEGETQVSPQSGSAGGRSYKSTLQDPLQAQAQEQTTEGQEMGCSYFNCGCGTGLPCTCQTCRFK